MSSIPTTEQFQQAETRELMRLLSAMAHERGGDMRALEFYESRWGPKCGNMTAGLVTKAFEFATKAAIGAGTTTDATWAGPLAASRISTGFLAQVRRASVIGKLDVV